jgi:hypothetical protein
MKVYSYQMQAMHVPKPWRGWPLSWVGLKKASNEVEPVSGGFIVKERIAGKVRAILAVFHQRWSWWEGNISSYQSIYDASGGPNLDRIRAVWAQVIESFGSHNIRECWLQW